MCCIHVLLVLVHVHMCCIHVLAVLVHVHMCCFHVLAVHVHLHMCCIYVLAVHVHLRMCCIHVLAVHVHLLMCCIHVLAVLVHVHLCCFHVLVLHPSNCASCILVLAASQIHQLWEAAKVNALLPDSYLSLTLGGITITWQRSLLLMSHPSAVTSSFLPKSNANSSSTNSHSSCNLIHIIQRNLSERVTSLYPC